MNQMADELELEISAIVMEMTPDQIAAVRIKLDAYLERGKELREKLDATMVEYLTKNDCEIAIGSVRFYVGNEKKTKCRDQVECLRSLLELFGPDHVGKQFLASDAFKQGAISKEVDSETFDRLFGVKREAKLEKGKSTFALQKTNDDFVR